MPASARCRENDRSPTPRRLTPHRVCRIPARDADSVRCRGRWPVLPGGFVRGRPGEIAKDRVSLMSSRLTCPDGAPGTLLRACGRTWIRPRRWRCRRRSLSGAAGQGSDRMARVRRWLGEALAEYRRHPRWVAAGLSVIAVALLAAGAVWVMRQLAPPGDAPAGTARLALHASTPARPHPTSSPGRAAPAGSPSGSAAAPGADTGPWLSPGVTRSGSPPGPGSPPSSGRPSLSSPPGLSSSLAPSPSASPSRAASTLQPGTPPSLTPSPSLTPLPSLTPCQPDTVAQPAGHDIDAGQAGELTLAQPRSKPWARLAGTGLHAQSGPQPTRRRLNDQASAAARFCRIPAEPDPGETSTRMPYVGIPCLGLDETGQQLAYVTIVSVRQVSGPLEGRWPSRVAWVRCAWRGSQQIVVFRWKLPAGVIPSRCAVSTSRRRVRGPMLPAGCRRRRGCSRCPR